MKIFILEDSENRIKMFKKHFKDHELDITKDISTAKHLLSTEVYDLICLDHDIDNDEYGSNDTGYDIAVFIKEKNIKTTVVLHTCNSIGASRMGMVLPESHFLPFPLVLTRVSLN